MENIDKSNFPKRKTDKAFNQIIELIDASIVLSEKLGKHPFAGDCSCMACITRKKRMLQQRFHESKFSL